MVAMLPRSIRARYVRWFNSEEETARSYLWTFPANSFTRQSHAPGRPHGRGRYSKPIIGGEGPFNAINNANHSGPLGAFCRENFPSRDTSVQPKAPKPCECQPLRSHLPQPIAATVTGAYATVRWHGTWLEYITFRPAGSVLLSPGQTTHSSTCQFCRRLFLLASRLSASRPEWSRSPRLSRWTGDWHHACNPLATTDLFR